MRLLSFDPAVHVLGSVGRRSTADGLAFHFSSPGSGIQAGIVLLALALYKAIEWGVTQGTAKKG